MGKTLKLSLALGIPIAAIVGVGIPTAVVHSKRVNETLEQEAYIAEMQDMIIEEMETSIYKGDILVTNSEEKDALIYSAEYFDWAINYYLDSSISFSDATNALKVTMNNSVLLNALGLAKYDNNINIEWSFVSLIDLVEKDGMTNEDGDIEDLIHSSILLTATRTYVFETEGSDPEEHSATINLAVKFKD